MLRVAASKTKPKGARSNPVIHIGIVADAAALGVTRHHLKLVLRGKRKSRSLLIRYHQLQRSKIKRA